MSRTEKVELTVLCLLHKDGKSVGAVMHVLVNDLTIGYWIFIENMLDAPEVMCL